MLVSIFRSCLSLFNVPERWRIWKVVIIPKAGLFYLNPWKLFLKQELGKTLMMQSRNTHTLKVDHLNFRCTQWFVRLKVASNQGFAAFLNTEGAVNNGLSSAIVEALKEYQFNDEIVRLSLFKSRVNSCVKFIPLPILS